jgi:hypothetical protein
MKAKKIYTMGMALTGVVLFAFTACADLAGPGTGSGETIPPGMGLARIRLGAGGAAQSIRTAVPDIGTLYFTLKFSASGKTDEIKNLSSGTTTLTVFLEPAVWKLEVKGYADSAHTNLRAMGTSSVSISAGTDASFNVYLTPDVSSGNTGDLYYSIGLPTISIRAFLGIYPIDNTPGTSAEYDISASGGGTATGTLLNLPEGSYRAVIDLYDNSGANKAAVWTGAVHIHDGSTTSLIRTFTAADFAECPPVVGETEFTLEAKLDAALASPAGSYTIVLGGETDLANFTPKNLTGSKNISITIRGNGETVQVASTGTPLFTVGASGFNSLSLTIQDLTLRGLSGNTVPVVQLDYRGTLLMKAGSRITGNTSFNDGGGVYMHNSGTFTMSGGAVSGNISSSNDGGGVYVMGGTFTMSGGAVSDNAAAGSASEGGGVYVNGGSFAMSGGTVSGNTTTRSGGGVYLFNGPFAMSGGAITGNTSSNDGGGVYALDSFTMSGGAITGNTASGNGGGGGVYINYGILFTMSGGEVSGNILSSTNSYGKEVVISSNGNFRMSGDARPERVFLANNARFITISGPLNGGIITHVDLGITNSASLISWEDKPILQLAGSYSGGDLTTLKEHFTLGHSKMTAAPWGTEALITGYEISDSGLFVVE